MIAKVPLFWVSLYPERSQGWAKRSAQISEHMVIPPGKEGSMGCGRCGGLIVKESVYDREGSSQVILMDRCLQCGHIEDPVSARNRAQINQSPTQKAKVRRDPEHPYPPIQLAKG